MTFKRDRQGRITSVIDPDRHEVRYGYDANGDMVSVTDRENHTTRLEYHDTRLGKVRGKGLKNIAGCD